VDPVELSPALAASTVEAVLSRWWELDGSSCGARGPETKRGDPESVHWRLTVAYHVERARRMGRHYWPALTWRPCPICCRYAAHTLADELSSIAARLEWYMGRSTASPSAVVDLGQAWQAARAAGDIAVALDANPAFQLQLALLARMLARCVREDVWSWRRFALAEGWTLD